FVGDQVFAVHHVFGGGARAVGRGQHHHAAQLFAVAMRHPLLERGERGLAGFARALVEVVDHVVGQQRLHAGPVAAVERGVVGEDEFGGAIVRAGAVDFHAVPPMANSAGSASRSTLPPDRTRPTLWPSKCGRCASTAASTVADEGSTSCLLRVHSSRIAATTCASSTVSTSAPAARRMSKLIAPSVPRRPSQTVSGTKSWSSAPFANERAPSAAPSGSAR